MKATSKRIVVDASVAQAAGMSLHPVSSACRDFLAAMMKICHRAVFSVDLLREWKRHESLFSRRWRAGMIARKKVCAVQPSSYDGLTIAIEHSGLDAKLESQTKKDAHLIAAALCTDGLVASCDDKARDSWQKVVARCDKAGDIMWVNPSKPMETPVDWLANSAPLERHRTLRQ